MKPITDPSFRYSPGFATDLRKTFARVKREQRKETRNRRGADVPVRIVRSEAPAAPSEPMREFAAPAKAARARLPTERGPPAPDLAARCGHSPHLSPVPDIA
jgi:hypothetical protein